MEHEPFFDNRTKLDILAVIVTILALALLFSVLAPNTGILSNYVARGLFLGLGIGAYAVPIAIFIWGVSLFVHHDSKSMGQRPSVSRSSSSHFSRSSRYLRMAPQTTPPSSSTTTTSATTAAIWAEALPMPSSPS